MRPYNQNEGRILRFCKAKNRQIFVPAYHGCAVLRWRQPQWQDWRVSRRQRWPRNTKVWYNNCHHFLYKPTNSVLMESTFSFYTIPYFCRRFLNGKLRYILVGTVTGNVNTCQGGVPDIYNFIGNKKVSNFKIILSICIIIHKWANKHLQKIIIYRKQAT